MDKNNTNINDKLEINNITNLEDIFGDEDTINLENTLSDESIEILEEQDFDTKKSLLYFRVDQTIQKLKKCNPILKNTYLIKVQEDYNSIHYTAFSNYFFETAMDQFPFSNLILYPRLIDNKTYIYILLTPEKTNCSLKFLKDFIPNCLFPYNKIKFEITKLNNLNVVLNHIIALKNEIDKYNELIKLTYSVDDILVDCFDEYDLIEDEN